MNDGVAVLIWVIAAFIGCLIGSTKNRKGEGLLLGILLGPVGCILAIFLPAPEEGSAAGVGVVALLIVGGGIWFVTAAASASRKEHERSIAQENQAMRAQAEREEFMERNHAQATEPRRAQPVWDPLRGPSMLAPQAYVPVTPTTSGAGPYAETVGLTTRVGRNTYITKPTDPRPPQKSAADVQAEILQKYGATK